MNWQNMFIGIPYKKAGRTREGADCYGLVRLIFEEVFSKTLPLLADFDSIDPDVISDIISEELPLLKFSPSSVVKEGVLVLLKIKNVPCHLGVCVNENEFIHTLYPHDSCIERLDSLKWRKRIEGYYCA